MTTPETQGAPLEVTAEDLLMVSLVVEGLDLKGGYILKVAGMTDGLDLTIAPDEAA